MGSGFRDFATNEELTSANVQDYLMEQAVMSFASATARNTAISSPAEGMICYLQDTNTYQTYDGSAWADWVDVIGFTKAVRPALRAYALNSSGAIPTVSTSSTTTLGFGTAGALFTLGASPWIDTGWSTDAPSADPEPLLAEETGMFQCNVFSEWAANASGDRQTQLRVGGGLVTGMAARHRACASLTTIYSFSGLIEITANDEIEVAVWQDSGSSISATVIVDLIKAQDQ